MHLTQEVPQMPKPSSQTTQGPQTGSQIPLNMKQGGGVASGYLPWIVSFVVWGLGVFMIFMLMPNDTWFAWRQFVARYVFQSDHITLSNNIFDRNQYIVGHTKLQKPGYLVLYFADQYDTGMRNPVGFTNLLLPGDYTNVQIKINDGRLEGEDPSQFSFGASLYIALFYDNGDKILNIMEPDRPKDVLAKDPFGQPIFAKLTL